MTKIISISIDNYTDDFLKRTGLSPSTILRHAVRMKSTPAFQEEEEAGRKIALLSEKLNKVLRYMEDRGFTENVLEEKGTKADSERGIRETEQKSNRNSDDARGIEAQDRYFGDGKREAEV